MLEEDKTIFEYRMSKEMKFTNMIKEEKLKQTIEKISYFTEDCGYIDGYIYRPETYDGQTKLPVVFNFHGGGMVLKYCEQDGIYCQEIANKVGVAVVNVDYAVAPEFKFPLPIYSAYEFIEQVLENSETYSIQKDNCLLMGHSAGGYLSTALCILNDTKQKFQVKGLIANYAVLKQDTAPSTRISKDIDKAIPISRMEQYHQWYFEKGEDTTHPLASPINAQGHIFPPSLIISADYDSLKNEEKQFAEKLRASGVKVKYENFDEAMHGFTHEWFDEYHPTQAKKAWALMQAFIREQLLMEA